MLLLGRRRLYLEALCELLNSYSELEASFASADDPFTSLEGPNPETILIDCPGNSGSLAELVCQLRGAYPDVPLVLLSPPGSRASATEATELGVTARLSSTLPTSELVKGLAGPTISGDRTRKRRPERSTVRSEWRLSSLTEREMSVLRLVVAGRPNDEIGEALGISRHTVRTHVQNIMGKLFARSRAELVSVALKSGIRVVPTSKQS